MPAPPKLTESSSSIIELKLYQRLWIRYFVQTRILLSTVDDRYYGNSEAYERVFSALAPTEASRKNLSPKINLNADVENEFAMEAAYRLAQAVHTAPMRPGSSLFDMDDPKINDDNLLPSLRKVRDDIFAGAENPPHALPPEKFSERFWGAQFKALEERLWNEFLIVAADTRFPQDRSAGMTVRAIAHLSLGAKGELSKIYQETPGEKEISEVERAWPKEKKSITSWEDFRHTSEVVLESLGVAPKMSAALLRNFGSFAIGHAFDSLLLTDQATAKKLFDDHEIWIEEFFCQDNRLASLDEPLMAALVAPQRSWPVVLTLDSSIEVPCSLTALGIKILQVNPAGIDLGKTSKLRYVNFEKIEAHDPEGAVAEARRRLNAFLNVATYGLSESPDSHLGDPAFCQIENGGWQWIGSGQRRGYPSKVIEKRALDLWDKETASLLQQAELNALAQRSLEALRLFRDAKEATDNQQKFTLLWLVVDVFLQNSNAPEKDLPLYQLAFAPRKGSPKPGTPDHVAWQKTRYAKFESDAKKFWMIRNHGGVHHGRSARWEERSLRLWTLKLEAAATLALRFCLNAALRSNPLKNPKECLAELRAQYQAAGIL